MVVATVDQHDLGVGVPERARRSKSGKAAADDDDALALSGGRLDNGGWLVSARLG
jgi:hypothetical protein